jgi:alpha-N-arabinofuranosidase
LRGTIGVDKPAVSSGSPTFPLDVLAALSEDRRTLTIAVVNPSEVPHTLRLAYRGGRPTGAGTRSTIGVAEFGARVRPGEPPVANITESAVADGSAPLTIAPATINLFRFRMP